MIRAIPFLLVFGLVAAAQSETASAGGKRFTFAMSGAQEAPGPGDPDGSGIASLRFNAGRERVCFSLTVEDIAPATAAHIHVAPAGVPGPVVVGLTAPTDGSSSGCVDLDRDEILEILREPAEYYVNVHNAEYPAGAVRGQLARH